MKGMAAFLLAAAVILPCGCAHREALCELPYWQVVSTDVEGCWISEYIAEGEITPTCNGYCFRAVQRRTFRPLTLTYKYPLGRLVKVQAPNIIITPACKPLWLKIMDLYCPPPDQCEPTKAFRWVLRGSSPAHPLPSPFFRSSKKCSIRADGTGVEFPP